MPLVYSASRFDSVRIKYVAIVSIVIDHLQGAFYQPVVIVRPQFLFTASRLTPRVLFPPNCGAGWAPPFLVPPFAPEPPFGPRVDPPRVRPPGNTEFSTWSCALTSGNKRNHFTYKHIQPDRVDTRKYIFYFHVAVARSSRSRPIEADFEIRTVCEMAAKYR